MRYFITGATGFIGSRLAKKLLEREGSTVYFLVRERRLAKAEALRRRWGVGAERAIPGPGDLTLPRLGVSDADLERLRGVDHMFHLAPGDDSRASAEAREAAEQEREGLAAAEETIKRREADLAEVERRLATSQRELETNASRRSAELLAEHTAVSEPVAKAMAENARRLTGAAYALSVTGIAGPDGGTEEKPVGTLFLGLAGPDGAMARRYRYLGDRERVRRLATQTALELLRRSLLGLRH